MIKENVWRVVEKNSITTLFMVLFLLTGCRTAKPISKQSGAMTSAEISVKLAKLAKGSDRAELVKIGGSVDGKPLDALLIGDFSLSADSPLRPLTFLLVGTQHGMEPSGGEALLRLADELVNDSDYANYLNPDGGDFPLQARYIIVPNLNPDGRDINRRVNAAGVNLSTDFVSLTQPESAALVDLLKTWRPDVLLDVHESAVWKRKSLGASGYLLDFDAQFETANNPNIDNDIRSLAANTILPAVIAGTEASGLPAQRYIGEITALDQTLVHGGLSLRNLRNYAGMRGVVSFLLENRLDPSFGVYETPRNIRERVRRQHVSVTSFVRVCLERRSAIRRVVDNARKFSPTEKSPSLFGGADYVPIPGMTAINIALRRLDDGVLENRVFAYNGKIIAGNPLPEANAYMVTGQVDRVAELLVRHGVLFSKTDKGLMVPGNQGNDRILSRLAISLLDPDSDFSIWRMSDFESASHGDGGAVTRIPRVP